MRKSLQLLADCGRILEKRSKSYLSYKEERQRVAAMVGGMFGTDIDPDLVTAVMVCTKLVRHKRRAEMNKDDFVDAINYLALAYEANSESSLKGALKKWIKWAENGMKKIWKRLKKVKKG